MKHRNNAVRITVCLFLVLLIIGSVVFATKSAFGILGQKRDNSVYFSDCLSPSFDPERSEAVRAEMKTLTEKAMTYALMKNDLTLFENEAYAINEMASIRKDTERSIKDTIYFTEEKIKTDLLDSETIQNRFVILSDSENDGAAVHVDGKLQYARTDENRIREYFESKAEKRSEETKLNISTAYREAKQYLDSLENTEYCVITQADTVKSGGYDSVRTNPGDADTFTVILTSDGTVTVKQSEGLPGIQRNFIEETVKEFTGPVELNIIFTGSLLFNESLKEVPVLHDECRSVVLSLILKVILFSLIAVAAIIVFTILLPIGNRKKSATILSAIIAAVSFAVIVLAVCLLSDSVKLFMDPTAGTSWLALNSDTIVLKACLRVSIATISFSGFLASVKAIVFSRKNKSTDRKENKSI